MSHAVETCCPSSWSDNVLIERMLRREGRAWREFHRRFDRLIYRSIYKVTQRFAGVLGSSDVDEIYAALMMALNQRDMHKLRSFEPERGHKLSTWIGLLATNASWDHLRALSRQPSRGSQEEAERMCSEHPDPFHTLAAREEWRLVSKTLRTFSDKDRTFVDLFFLQEQSPEQIAERMHISVKTVYSKKHKIRCRLENALRGSSLLAA